MSAGISFNPNTGKILEAILWIANKRPGIDFIHIMKILYYADKEHLVKHGRPVIGDKYCRLPMGPVPSTAYDLVRLNAARIDAHTLSEAGSAICTSQTRIGDYDVPTVQPLRPARMDFLSRSDVVCLQNALDAYADMPSTALSDLTHKERAWIAAIPKRELDYALMIDEDVPDRDELIQELRETASHIVF